jgi:hypothetical protein
LVTAKYKGAMASVVLRCGHASSAILMPTLEYQ